MTYVLVAEITTREGHEAAYWELLREVILELSQDPCFMEFSVHQSPEQPGHYLLYERWTNKEDYEQLRAGAAFRAYLAKRDAYVSHIERKDWILKEDFRSPP